MADDIVICPDSYGLSVRGGTCRGVHCVKDASGRDCIVLWLMDRFCERVLQIDAETGAAESIAIEQEMDYAPFASLCSRAGKSYSLFCHWFFEFDPALKKFTFIQKVDAGARLGMGMMEDEAGGIWCTAYPDCHLFRFVYKINFAVERSLIACCAIKESSNLRNILCLKRITTCTEKIQSLSIHEENCLL